MNIDFDENGMLIIPKSMKHAKEEKNRKEKQKEFLQNYSDKRSLNIEVAVDLSKNC